MLVSVRGQSAQALVRTHFIIYETPRVKLALSVGNTFKYAAIEHLVTQETMETRAYAVLPWMLRLNKCRLHLLPGAPTKRMYATSCRCS